MALPLMLSRSRRIVGCDVTYATSGFHLSPFPKKVVESRMPSIRPEARIEPLKGEETMSPIRWDPFREFNTLPARLGGFFGRDWETPMSTTTWNPSVDIFENDNEVVVK